MRKEPVRPHNASAISTMALPVALAASIVAAALVPSFSTGMLTAPLSDLLPILGLLAIGRIALAAGALDAGVAAPGLSAIGLMVRLACAGPACLLAFVTLSLATGTTGLDGILSALGQGADSSGPPAAALAAASLAVAALAVDGDDGALSQELSGPDLALFGLTATLQRLVWIDLVTGLALPHSLAAAWSNPLYGLIGLAGWVARVAIVCLGLGALRRWTGLLAPSSRAHAGRLAGTALLLGLLAPLLLLVGRGAP